MTARAGVTDPITRLGQRVFGIAATMAEALVLAGQNVLVVLTGRVKVGRTLEQIHQIGTQSLPIVAIAMFFTGMVMAVHVATALAKFGAELQLAQIVLVSMVRELSPIFTALLIAGRAGSGITAELGAMQLTEQLSAMRALSLDVRAELLAPRIVATTLAAVALTVVGDLTGVLGGYLVGVTRQRILFDTFHAETIKALRMIDVYCGLFKAAFFGFVIAVTGCTLGLRTRRGAGELGTNTKRAVVAASFIVLVSDYFLTELFVAVFER